MKTSIIIPAYGQKHLTIKCLETLEGVDQIIVIDDDGGFAETVNRGLSIATGDVFIVCNNDIEFIQPDWLSHLIKGFNEDYDIVSLRTSDSDGWETDNYISEGDKFGSFWAMKRKVYETIGGLDESFGRGYFEDLDYHKRAEDAGFRVGKNHAGLVEHKGKATFTEVDPDDTAFKTAREKFIQKWGEVW